MQQEVINKKISLVKQILNATGNKQYKISKNEKGQFKIKLK